MSKIEDHVLELSGRLWKGLKGCGMELMTPESANERAGNICFMASNIQEITEWLESRGILVWGSYAGVGRARVSTHLYNSSRDVDRLLAALRNVPGHLQL